MYRIFLILLVFQWLNLSSQSASADCIYALFIQSGTSVAITTTAGAGNVIDLTTTPSHSISNPSINPSGNNVGCLLSGETMSSWYKFTVCNTGSLQLIIGSNNNNFLQAGYYDWSIWKYTSNTCSQIINNLIAPLRCNWNSSSSGGTGICDTLNLPSGGHKGNYELPLPVNAGDSLVMCINNYSSINYFIDFISVGTSSINCNLVTNLKNEISAPANSIIYLQSMRSIQIKSFADEISLFDLTGKPICVFSTVNHDHIIDCSALENGIYIVALKKNNQIFERKKVIIH